jgi:hypothetical protein
MRIDGRMQRRWQTPGLETHAGHELTGASGRNKRQAPAIAGDEMAALR